LQGPFGGFELGGGDVTGFAEQFTNFNFTGAGLILDGLLHRRFSISKRTADCHGRDLYGRGGFLFGRAWMFIHTYFQLNHTHGHLQKNFFVEPAGKGKNPVPE
jgi:hypothetical protein